MRSHLAVNAKVKNCHVCLSAILDPTAWSHKIPNLRVAQTLDNMLHDTLAICPGFWCAAVLYWLASCSSQLCYVRDYLIRPKPWTFLKWSDEMYSKSDFVRMKRAVYQYEPVFLFVREKYTFLYLLSGPHIFFNMMKLIKQVLKYAFFPSYFSLKHQVRRKRFIICSIYKPTIQTIKISQQILPSYSSACIVTWKGRAPCKVTSTHRSTQFIQIKPN